MVNTDLNLMVSRFTFFYLMKILKDFNHSEVSHPIKNLFFEKKNIAVIYSLKVSEVRNTFAISLCYFNTNT